jgi:hypothetical protein
MLGKVGRQVNSTFGAGDALAFRLAGSSTENRELLLGHGWRMRHPRDSAR